MSDTVREIEDLLDTIQDHLVDLGARRYYKVQEFHDPGYPTSSTQRRVLCERAEADLVSSEVGDGLHAPAIDIDLPCRVIPSSTPGHFHLLIEKAMSWKQYENLLKAMVDAGVVEQGFYTMAKACKATYLRVPEKPKDPKPPDSVELQGY